MGLLKYAFPSAQNRNRTCTPLREPDFESSASTSSAIWAKTGCNITEIYR